MATATMDFKKTPADQRVTVWIGPKGSIANIQAPTAAEINAMILASQSISWNDYDFGIQASETSNDPSLADESTYEDFGQANFGGNISFYYPKEYDDASNLHSVIYDLTDIPWTELEIVARIDGDVKVSRPAANGDFVSVYEVMTDGETNSLQGADALRRTVNMLQQAGFSHRVLVGPHTLSVTPASLTIAEGTSKPLKVLAGDTTKRVYTNAVTYRSSDPTVATVSNTGVVTRLKTGAATITVLDEATDETATVTLA